MSQGLPANKSQSVDLVTRLELKTYEFKYDAIVGRTQLGPVGSEIREVLPDAVDVVPERRVVDHENQQTVALTNFHVVDKDSVLMHNVAATQVLLADTATHASELHGLTLRGYLEQEASVQQVERRRIAEAVVTHVERLMDEARVRGERSGGHWKTSLPRSWCWKTPRIRWPGCGSPRRRRSGSDRTGSRAQLQETEEVLKEKQPALERERMWLEHNATLERAHIDAEGRIKQQ